MKPTLSEIQQFTSQKNIAVAGVSRNPKKFGNAVYKHLKENDYHVYAVNPNLDEFEGDKCYHSLSDLPNDVTALHINTKPEHTQTLVEAAFQKGISNIWVQQGAVDKQAYKYGKEKGLNMVSGQCIFMYSGEVKGPHKFHGFLKKVFGMYPK